MFLWAFNQTLEMKTVLLFTILSFGVIRAHAIGIIAPAEYYNDKNQPAVTSTQSVENNVNPSSCTDTEPIQLENFVGNMVNKKLRLEWTIGDNDHAQRFEVLRSEDGKNFSMAALVFSSEKNGREVYGFFEKLKEQRKMYYRLRMIDKKEQGSLSNVILIEPKS
jgi:hypothetical protein